MGAETQNQRLAGDATRRAQAMEGVRRRRAAIRSLPPGGAPETGRASMFPNEAPGQAQSTVPGLEEAMFRRGEITQERDRTGRREEIYNNLRRGMEEGGAERVAPGGAVERGAGMFGAPLGGAGMGQPNSGIVFGPGRANRMPEPGTPEHEALLQRMRGLGKRVDALR